MDRELTPCKEGIPGHMPFEDRGSRPVRVGLHSPPPAQPPLNLGSYCNWKTKPRPVCSLIFFHFIIFYILISLRH